MDDDDLMVPVSAVTPGRKPKISVYVVMMIISLVALLAGCLFLYLEMKRYGGFGSIRGRISATTPAAISLIAEDLSQPNVSARLS